MDFNGDGVLELFFGDYDGGRLSTARHEGGAQFEQLERVVTGTAGERDSHEVLRALLAAKCPEYDDADSMMVQPHLVDFDDDGDFDLFVAAYNTCFYLENLGTRTAPNLSNQPREVQFPDLERLEHQYLCAQICDWDGDGHKDIVVGTQDGAVHWYPGTTESSRTLAFAPRQRLLGHTPLVGVPRGSYIGAAERARSPVDRSAAMARICVHDHNGDGKLDLLVGERFKRGHRSLGGVWVYLRK